MKTPAELEYEYNGSICNRNFDAEEFFAEVQKEAQRPVIGAIGEYFRFQDADPLHRNKSTVKDHLACEERIKDMILRFYQSDCVVDAEPRDDHPKLFKGTIEGT